MNIFDKYHKSRALSAILACMILFSSCSAVKNDPAADPAQPADPLPSTSPTVSSDENIPDNIVSPGTPAVSQDNGGRLPTSQTPAFPEDPTVTAPPVNIPPADTADTNAGGEVIDDWQAGLKLPNANEADELYASYGIDRTYREGYYRQISQECEFPIVHISTENKQEVLSRDEYVNCFVEIFNCEDIYRLDAAAAEIRVRGNASAYYGDKDKLRNGVAPYRIRFKEKQSVLGLNDFARCRSWVLLKTFESGVRDHLAYNIARTVNDGKYYVTDAKFVQVYLNEKYAGIYVLCEQTQANSERVDITEAEEGYTGTDIGYLVELDNYATSEDYFFYLNYNKEPITDVYGTWRVPVKYGYSVKNDLYSDDQLKFIERYFEVAWEVAMRAIRDGEYYRIERDGNSFNLLPAQDEFISAFECVNSVIDVQSVVYMYMTYEITNDQDLGGGSFYFAVDFSEESNFPRLTMTAPWDFDWGYSDYHCEADGGIYAAKFKDSNFVNNYGDRSNPWLILFYSADWFQDIVKEVWKDKYQSLLQVIDEEEQLIVNYSDDFDKDGVHRASHAKANVNWAKKRVEYLNSLWG